MRYFVMAVLACACCFGACETVDETPIEMVAGAPGAPDAPVGWTAHDVRVKSAVTTATHVVVWISYEKRGPGVPGQTVSRRIDIPK